ncbi:MAG: hypothetical protein HUU60_06965 [Armatimonadetes bacterium]|nr:hypothetical protein [Armatimonadota bacterium]
MILVYNIALLLTAPIWLAYALYRIIFGTWRSDWQHRFGFVPRSSRPSVWIHAVSVGEMIAAIPVIKALRKQRPQSYIVLTTTTPGGREIADRQAAEWVDQIAYFPLDPFAWIGVRRIRPTVLALMESEFWLNAQWFAKRQGATVLLLNGRVSDRTYRRAPRFRFYYRAALGLIDQALAQTQTDADRLTALGADAARTVVAGNTKFDEALDETESGAQWKTTLGLPPESKLLVTGSSRSRMEDDLAIRAFVVIAKAVPSLRLLLAPRHLDRVEECLAACREAGLSAVRRSAISGPHDHPVIVLDTFGELSRIYSAAEIAIIGGGFEPFGGQNLIQPLARGAPVIFGPHMHNFRDAAHMAKSEGAGFETNSADETAKLCIRILTDDALRLSLSEKARRLAKANQGASERCIAAISATLSD